MNIKPLLEKVGKVVKDYPEKYGLQVFKSEKELPLNILQAVHESKFDAEFLNRENRAELIKESDPIIHFIYKDNPGQSIYFTGSMPITPGNQTTADLLYNRALKYTQPYYYDPQLGVWRLGLNGFVNENPNHNIVKNNLKQAFIEAKNTPSHLGVINDDSYMGIYYPHLGFGTLLSKYFGRNNSPALKALSILMHESIMHKTDPAVFRNLHYKGDPIKKVYLDVAYPIDLLSIEDKKLLTNKYGGSDQLMLLYKSINSASPQEVRATSGEVIRNLLEKIRKPYNKPLSEVAKQHDLQSLLEREVDGMSSLDVIDLLRKNGSVYADDYETLLTSKSLTDSFKEKYLDRFKNMLKYLPSVAIPVATTATAAMTTLPFIFKKGGYLKYFN